jgi:hypothetical protein
MKQLLLRIADFFLGPRYPFCGAWRSCKLWKNTEGVEMGCYNCRSFWTEL